MDEEEQLHYVQLRTAFRDARNASFTFSDIKDELLCFLTSIALHVNEIVTWDQNFPTQAQVHFRSKAFYFH